MNGEIARLADLPEVLACEWEALAAAPAGDAPMDRLRDVMAQLPAAAERLAEYGIPRRVVLDTYGDIGLWASDHRRATGRWGLTDEAHGWLHNHLRGKLFRIGRMQFCPGLLDADWNLRAYRRRSDGAVLALVDREALFREDGQLSGTNGVAAGAAGFRGASRTYGQYVEGTLLSPYGCALNRTVRLEMGEWELALETGMPVGDLHVPAGPGYTVEACRASLVAMAAFEREHAAALGELTGIRGPSTAYCLGSWLLDAQLEQLLPPEKAIVQCLRAYYLVPALADEAPMLERVFGVSHLPEGEIDDTYRQTSLQRAILDFMSAGGRMRYNLGFVLSDDVANFGAPQYRTRYDALTQGNLSEG